MSSMVALLVICVALAAIIIRLLYQNKELRLQLTTPRITMLENILTIVAAAVALVYLG